MNLVGSIQYFFDSWQFSIFIGMFKVFSVVFLFVALPSWTYYDAEKRGAYAPFWAAVSFFFSFFGWLVYILMRPREYIDDVKERELEIRSKESLLSKTDISCPSCQKPVESTYLICPFCRKKLKNQCEKCGRALNLSWDICPFCKTTQKKE